MLSLQKQIWILGLEEWQIRVDQQLRVQSLLCVQCSTGHEDADGTPDRAGQTENTKNKSHSVWIAAWGGRGRGASAGCFSKWGNYVDWVCWAVMLNWVSIAFMCRSWASIEDAVRPWNKYWIICYAIIVSPAQNLYYIWIFLLWNYAIVVTPSQNIYNNNNAHMDHMSRPSRQIIELNWLYLISLKCGQTQLTATSINSLQAPVTIHIITYKYNLWTWEISFVDVIRWEICLFKRICWNRISQQVNIVRSI